VNAYLLLASKTTEKGVQGEAFNFGLQSRVTVMDMTQAVLRLMGREDMQPIIRNDAKREIKDQSLDASKARNILGWAPTYSLEQGVVETIHWYRDFFRDKVAIEDVAMNVHGK
jgi:CDP-glucose 4,6-dehydratase